MYGEAASHSLLVCTFESDRERRAWDPAVLSDHVETGDADVANFVFFRASHHAEPGGQGRHGVAIGNALVWADPTDESLH
jgi:hypothetical protein